MVYAKAEHPGWQKKDFLQENNQILIAPRLLRPPPRVEGDRPRPQDREYGQPGPRGEDLDEGQEVQGAAARLADYEGEPGKKAYINSTEFHKRFLFNALVSVVRIPVADDLAPLQSGGEGGVAKVRVAKHHLHEFPTYVHCKKTIIIF